MLREPFLHIPGPVPDSLFPSLGLEERMNFFQELRNWQVLWTGLITLAALDTLWHIGIRLLE